MEDVMAVEQLVFRLHRNVCSELGKKVWVCFCPYCCLVAGVVEITATRSRTSFRVFFQIWFYQMCFISRWRIFTKWEIGRSKKFPFLEPLQCLFYNDFRISINFWLKSCYTFLDISHCNFYLNLWNRK
jgi:hypothetical protein